MIERDFRTRQFTLAPQVASGIVALNNRTMVQALYARCIQLAGAAALVIGYCLIGVGLSPEPGLSCDRNSMGHLIATVAASHTRYHSGIVPVAFIPRTNRGGIIRIALAFPGQVAWFTATMFLIVELTLGLGNPAYSTNARRIGRQVTLPHMCSICRVLRYVACMLLRGLNRTSTGFAIRAGRSALPRELIYRFSLPTFRANAGIPLLPDAAFRAGRLSHRNPPLSLTALFTPRHTLIKRFVLVREGIYRLADVALGTSLSFKKITHISIILRTNPLVNACHYVATDGGRTCPI
jgi:hypothetical protein